MAKKKLATKIKENKPFLKGLAIDDSENKSKEIQNNEKSYFNNLFEKKERKIQYLTFNKKWVFLILFTNFTIIVLNIILIIFLFNGFTPFKESLVSTINTSQVKQVTDSENGVFEINNFYKNQAVINIGSKIDMRNEFLQTNSHANCQTPVLPPTINGCFVKISPFKVTNSQNTVFNTLKIDAELKGNSQIIITSDKLKANIEGKELQPNKFSFVLNSQNKNMEIILPPFFGQDDLLNFDFWDQDKSNVKINKLIFSTQNLNDQREVNLTLSPEFLERNDGKEFSFFQDTNSNSVFETSLDRRVENCDDIVPIEGLIVDKNAISAKLKLNQQEKCLDNNGKKFKTLMPGNWFLIEKNNFENKYIFKIEKNIVTPEIKL
jgi:hypothetical protein